MMEWRRRVLGSSHVDEGERSRVLYVGRGIKESMKLGSSHVGEGDGK